MDLQNFVETQLLLGKQVLEIILDLLKDENYNWVSFTFKNK